MTRLCLALAALICLTPSAAEACGGCFSPVAPPAPGQSNGQYVVQDAERIVFTHVPGTGITRVWVEVRYTGEAKDFGWVLPMPKQPTVTTGPTVALDRIDGTTAPRYQLQFGGAENCRDPRIGCEPPATPDTGATADAGGWGGADASSGGGGGPAPGVKVLDAGQTGPYDFVVIASKSADALQAWLTTRGYKTPKTATPIIQSHLDKGDVFVAIKLSNGKGVNLIRPIVLEMKDSDPCVPLRLTSIAAAEEMSVVVTLGGPGRAVPKNMLHVQINDALIDWFGGGQNYDQLLAAAVDEAGGRAFATQSAQPPSSVAGSLWSEAQLSVAPFEKVSNLVELAVALRFAGQVWLSGDAATVFAEKAGIIEPIYKAFGTQTPVQALQQLWTCGAIWAGTVPVPGNPKTTPCIKAGASFFGSGPSLDPKDAQAIKVDGEKLAKALHTEIAQPINQLRKDLLATKTVTRLAMRISADEMERDPIFGFHPNLPDVNETHTAMRRNVCSTGWLPWDRVRLTVPGLGSYVLSTGTANLGLDPRFAKAPVARVIEVLDESGAPIPVTPAQVELVDTALAGAELGKPSPAAGLALDKAKPWAAPASDPPVKHLAPWKQPYNCVPKPGWKDGALPPTGGPIDEDGGSTSGGGSDAATGPDGGSSGGSGGSGGSGSSGGAADGAVVDASGGSSGGDSTGASGGAKEAKSGGCSAGRGASTPWGPLAALLMLAVVVLRRRAAGS